MNKKNIIFLVLVAFILTGVNATFANDDGFSVQSLNVDNNIEQDNTSSMNFSRKKFPKQDVKSETKEETNILTPEQIYIQQNPYTYNTNYIEYKKVIGPYYSTGINRGFGYNYKGFGYNYKGHGYNYGYSTSNRHPIFVSPPPPPPKPPHMPAAPPATNKPNAGGPHPMPPHHGF